MTNNKLKIGILLSLFCVLSFLFISKVSALEVTGDLNNLYIQVIDEDDYFYIGTETNMGIGDDSIIQAGGNSGGKIILNYIQGITAYNEKYKFSFIDGVHNEESITNRNSIITGFSAYSYYDAEIASKFYYGKNYKVNDSHDIRLLPSSSIRFTEEDFGFWNPDDDIMMRLKCFSDEIGCTNKIILESGKIDGDAGANLEFASKNLDIDLYLAIPLKLKTGIGTKYIKDTLVIENTGKPVVDQVTAHIKIQKSDEHSEFTFESGLENIPNLNDYITSNDDEETGDSGPLQTEIRREESFQGHGLTAPGENTFLGISNITDADEFIIGITNFILSFVAVIAVLMLVYGGYLWIIDQGDGSLAEKSRKTIAAAVIGILIIISAYTIVNTVIALEGNRENDPSSAQIVGAGIGGVIGHAIDPGTGTIIGGVTGGLLGDALD